MADVKTCEQYVLAELEKCQWDIDSLRAINAELDDQVGSLQEEVHLLERYIDRLHSVLSNGSMITNPSKLQLDVYLNPEDVQFIKNFIEHGLRRNEPCQNPLQ